MFDLRQYITEANDALNEASPAFDEQEFQTAVMPYVKKMNLNGWKFDYDMSGAWGWYHPRYKNLEVFATPFWEGTKGIPLQISDVESGGQKFQVLPYKAGDASDKSPQDSAKKAADRYGKVMKTWFQRNLKNIVKWDKEGIDRPRPRGMEDNPFQ